MPGTLSGSVNIDGSREETSLLAFLSVLLRHRRTIALASLAGALVLAVFSANEASRYEARASFTTRASRASSQVPSALHRMGLDAGSGIDPSQTTVFYSELVKARSILGPVARQQYTVPTDSGPLRGTLASFYGFGERRPEVAAALMLNELNRSVSAAITSRTGTVILTVQSIRPELASQIAANILTELNGYSLKRQIGDASAERAFVQSLLGESLGRLRRAEEEMGNFRELNRDYENSAQLRMQSDRLARAVSMEQQVYIGLAGAYHQARIVEARDLSPLTIVEPPETPVSPQTGTAVRKTLLGLIGGLLVGIVIAFLKERMNETRAAGTSALAEFRRERDNAFGGLSPSRKPMS